MAVVLLRNSPDNAGNICERNGDTTMTVDEEVAASTVRAESTSAVNRVVAMSLQTNRELKNDRPISPSLLLSAESVIREFTERQTNSPSSAAAQAAEKGRKEIAFYTFQLIIP